MIKWLRKAGSASGLSITLIGLRFSFQTLRETLTDRRSYCVFNCKGCMQPAARYPPPVKKCCRVCPPIENWLVAESLALVYCGVYESRLRTRYLSRKSDCWILFVCFNVAKPVVGERFRLAFDFRFSPWKYWHLSAHGGFVCLKVVPFVKLEQVFLQGQS